MNKISVLHPGFVEIIICGIALTSYLPVERPALISQCIRRRYSNDDELAILANGCDTEAHTTEYNDYQSFRAAVKAGIAEIKPDIDRINKEWQDSQPDPDPMSHPAD